MAATPVVFLPGTLCDERVFAPVLPVGRPAVLRHHQVLASVTDPEQWVSLLLDALPPRFALVGFSLGGLLALALCEQAPERVRGMALIASNARRAQPEHWKNRQALLAQWDSGGADAVIDTLLPRYGLSASAQQASVRAMARDHSRALFDTQLRFAAERPERSAVWRHAPGPALIISGERDPLCGPAMQDELKALRPDADWLSLPDSGHFPTLDAPAPCREALARWAQRLP
jgi:pimeloyl-ACP methyl ester carboxylesterase